MLQYQKYLGDHESDSVREQISLKINFSPQVALSHMGSQIWDCARMGVNGDADRGDRGATAERVLSSSA